MRMPNIEKAYLHATTAIEFRGESVSEYIRKLISLPTELNGILTRIEEARADLEKKRILYESKKGRPESFIVRLKEALIETDNTQKRLDASNIDAALEALEKKTKSQIQNIGSLSDEQIGKIGLYSYVIE
jgi:hypothetical protein